MTIINKLLAIGLVIAAFSCDEIDNYDAPNGYVHGQLIDKITNQPFQSQQPNGFIIRLFEQDRSVNSPISFHGKSNGTFENALIFQNTYKIVPVEGAFFPVDTSVVKVGKESEINFEVIPFLAITEVTVSTNSNKITTNYNITRSKVGAKIIERITLVSEIPTVDNITYKFKLEKNLSEIPDESILNQSFSDVIDGLTSGKTYYVRVGARTNNANRKYNFSKIFEITVQ